MRIFLKAVFSNKSCPRGSGLMKPTNKQLHLDYSLLSQIFPVRLNWRLSLAKKTIRYLALFSNNMKIKFCCA
jgi:hypothetical protein